MYIQESVCECVYQGKCMCVCISRKVYVSVYIQEISEFSSFIILTISSFWPPSDSYQSPNIVNVAFLSLELRLFVDLLYVYITKNDFLNLNVISVDNHSCICCIN